MGSGNEAVKRGAAELAAVRREGRALYWAVAVFSFFVNLLMLTGPLYMLNVYDRVLGSRSLETLIALSVLVAFLYGMMGILDYVRGRVMGRLGARFQARLDRRVFAATLHAQTLNRVPQEARTGLRDLEAVQRLITSPALMAVFDLPFIPLFFAGIFVFHMDLGLLALVGGAVLIVVTLANQITTRKPLEAANAASFQSEALGAQIELYSMLKTKLLELASAGEVLIPVAAYTM
ncbi:MAG: hypothetical protein KKB02_11150, partial [Alphaproteobacteria bacterium]|nr:hypothetical protein [Alphaproteobacteria bacterium]